MKTAIEMFRPWMAILLETCNVGPLPGSGPDILARTIGSYRKWRLIFPFSLKTACA